MAEQSRGANDVEGRVTGAAAVDRPNEPVPKLDALGAAIHPAPGNGSAADVGDTTREAVPWLGRLVRPGALTR